MFCCDCVFKAWQPGMGGQIQGAPSQPPMDNPNTGPPPMPGPPPMSGFHQFNGYENVGPFGQGTVNLSIKFSNNKICFININMDPEKINK